MKANISSIMFGVGMQDYRLKFGIQTLPMVHNALFEIIVMWGFVGLGAVFLWLFILWKNIHIMHDGTYNKLVYLPLLGFAIFEQSQQFFAGYYQHLPIFMLCMLIIKCYCNEHYTEPVEAGIA